MRIGILGGTFDPIHIGHLIAAINARDELNLEKVLLVVANQPWQKVTVRQITPSEIRFAMVKEAVQSLQGLEACDLEIARGGLSYTADTIAGIKRTYSEPEIYLLVGTDVAKELSTWERVEEFRNDVHLVVVSRPTEDAQDSDQFMDPIRSLEEDELASSLLGWKASFLTVPALAISSSHLRHRVKANKSLDFLVPQSVIDIIYSNKLYC
ncbi:MAG: nicotinate-nucleotide adenylyltransferase [Firmicutes bacterium]|nr:nicotinate-nucleotide adenylyltransferase [Bacillota bacterium]